MPMAVVMMMTARAENMTNGALGQVGHTSTNIHSGSERWGNMSCTPGFGQVGDMDVHLRP